jgi:hypothetical protein
MILNNPAKLIPTKNLVPDFNNSAWFQDYTSVGGVVEVDKYNPSKMKLTTTQGAQARLIQIPVEFGKTYTLSFKTCTGLYRIYKGALRNHDDYKWLNKGNDTAGVTFTVDASFNGFVTLRLTAGSAGYYYFENFQLEDGTVATAFEPYKGVNKKSSLVPKGNILPPFTEWVNANTGNVINVTLNPTSASFYSYAAWMGIYTLVPMESNTTYTFSYKPNKFISDDLQFYARFIDSKGVQLGGAWPLHRDSTLKTPVGTAKAKITAEPTTSGVKKQISVPRIQLEKGSAATPMALYELAPKSASLVPKRNLLNGLNDFTLNNFVLVSQENNLKATYKAISATTSNSFFQVKVKQNTDYFFSLDMPIDMYIGVYNADASKSISSYTGGGYKAFNTGNNSVIRIYIRQSTPGTIFTVANPLLVENPLPVDFEPYQLANKMDVLVPRRNVVPPLKYWTKTDGNAEVLKAYEGKINPISNYTGFKYSASLGLKRDTTYTISIDEITPNAVFFLAYLDSGGVNRYTTLNSDSKVKQFIVPASAQYYWLEMHFQTYRGEAYFKNFMIQEGPIKNPFEPLYLVKSVSSYVFKAPYRNYPFLFKRESVEMFEGVQYGYNSPRLKNGGILLEEYTYNMLGGKALQPNSPATISDSGTYSIITAGSSSNYAGAYMNAITVKAVTTYTLSAKVEEVGSAKGKVDFVIEQTGGTTIRQKPVKFGDRYYITFKTGSGVTRISTCFYMNGAVSGDTFTLGKDVQLEERPYPTSPATGFRKADDLQIPIKLDVQGGSIEMEFDYHYSDGATQYLFDTNPEERWLIYKETYNSWIVYTNGTSRGYLSKNPIEGRNTLKLSWTATDFELILNGEKVAGKAHAITGNQNRIFLGQRYTIGSHLDDAVYSFVIKDHNGNIQFEM